MEDYISNKLKLLKQNNDYKDYSISNHITNFKNSISKNDTISLKYNNKNEQIDYKNLIFREVEIGIKLIENKNNLENELDFELEKQKKIDDEINKINNIEKTTQDELENNILIFENQIPNLKFEIDNKEDKIEELSNKIIHLKESNNKIKNRFQEIIDMSNKKCKEMENLMKIKMNDLDKYKNEVNNKIYTKKTYINDSLKKLENDNISKLNNINDKYEIAKNKRIKIESELRALTEKYKYLKNEFDENGFNLKEEEENKLNKEFFIKKTLLISKENNQLEEIKKLDLKNDNINNKLIDIQNNDKNIELKIEDKKSELIVEYDNKKYQNDDNILLINDNKNKNNLQLNEIENLNFKINNLKLELRKNDKENKEEINLSKKNDDKEIYELNKKIKNIKIDNFELQNQFDCKKNENEELNRKLKNINNKIKYNLTHNIDKTINSYKKDKNYYN